MAALATSLPVAIAWAGTSAALSACGTWLALRYALRRNLLDLPGVRRSHLVATPRGGGIAIVIVLLAAIAILSALWPASRGLLLAGGCGLILVAGAGWADDHRPQPVLLRLIVHCFASALLVVAVYLRHRDVVLALTAGVLAIGLVNAWNFMDGINGLAASQASIAALGYAIVAPAGPSGLLAIALTGACLGFLPFNTPRARIFLGDVGSGALGFALALLVILFADVNATITTAHWIPLAAFIVDAALTLSLRMIRRERWWTPHVRHLYQRWVGALGSHLAVTVVFGIWTLLGTVMMIMLNGASPMLERTVTIAWYFCTAAAWISLSRQFPFATMDRTA